MFVGGQIRDGIGQLTPLVNRSCERQ